jgi:hypothetical protein
MKGSQDEGQKPSRNRGLDQAKRWGEWVGGWVGEKEKRERDCFKDAFVVACFPKQCVFLNPNPRLGLKTSQGVLTPKGCRVWVVFVACMP